MKRHLPPAFPTRIKRLRVKFGLTQTRLAERMGASFASVDNPPTIDFSADPDRGRLVVEAERLTYGHLFNPAFATEISLINPLPRGHGLPRARGAGCVIIDEREISAAGEVEI